MVNQAFRIKIAYRSKEEEEKEEEEENTRDRSVPDGSDKNVSPELPPGHPKPGLWQVSSVLGKHDVALH